MIAHCVDVCVDVDMCGCVWMCVWMCAMSSEMSTWVHRISGQRGVATGVGVAGLLYITHQWW